MKTVAIAAAGATPGTLVAPMNKDGHTLAKPMPTSAKTHQRTMDRARAAPSHGGGRQCAARSHQTLRAHVGTQRVADKTGRRHRGGKTRVAELQPARRRCRFGLHVQHAPVVHATFSEQAHCRQPRPSLQERRAAGCCRPVVRDPWGAPAA